jgi:hypothetical protein
MAQSGFISFQCGEALGALKKGLTVSQIDPAVQCVSVGHALLGFRNPIHVFAIELLNGQYQSAAAGQPPLFVVCSADPVLGEMYLRSIKFSSKQSVDQIFLNAPS